MRIVALLTTVAALAAGPAIAQSTEEAPFSGIYVGGSFGAAVQGNDIGSSILFDRDLNGSFGDTVTTAGGTNAFSPGFCNGSARSALASDGCNNDGDDIEYAGRVGVDKQYGHLVVGVLGEFGRAEITDSVTAFSTTPASYTMTRSLKYNASVRGRIGYAANTTLFYGTGGAAYGKVRNLFSTTNTANSFTANGSQDAWGFSAGGGVEQKIGRHFSVGLEYLYTDLQDGDARIRVGAGTAPATSPFLLAGAGGTDFRRSDDNFRWHSIRATASFRF